MRERCDTQRREIFRCLENRTLEVSPVVRYFRRLHQETKSPRRDTRRFCFRWRAPFRSDLEVLLGESPRSSSQPRERPRDEVTIEIDAFVHHFEQLLGHDRPDRVDCFVTRQTILHQTF